MQKAPSGLDIFLYGNIIRPWREQRQPRTYSTPLPSHGGGRSSICWHAVEHWLPRPAISKHLGMLRKVGIVSVTNQGQQRLYNFEARKLKLVHDWVKTFERLSSHQLDRIKERVERSAQEQSNYSIPLNPKKGAS